MSGGMDWFRWHHGAVSDPKFQLVARKAGVRVADVIATWACLLEAASQSADRGHPGAIDFEALDCAMGFDDGVAERIHRHMQGREMVEVATGRIAQWEKRQPKRERVPADTSTGRVQAFRARQHGDEPGNTPETPGNANETPCNAKDGQETPRGEERREEKSNPVVVGHPAIDQLPGFELPVTPPASGKPECPHREIIALYHEILPMCPEVREWSTARATALRGRWNQSKDRQHLDFWRELFEYIATSDFLTGRAGKTPFLANLGWIVKSENFTKIVEGNYANK